MGDLDDYNRRMSLGDMAGAPRSLGDVSAQMQLDAQRQTGRSAPQGGGSVDVSARKAGVLFAAGLVMAALGVMAAYALTGGAAIAAGAVAVIGSGLALFFGFGLLTVVLHRLGPWRVLAALAVGALAWGLAAPWLAAIGLPVPAWLAGTVAGALVFVGRGWRR